MTAKPVFWAERDCALRRHTLIGRALALISAELRIAVSGFMQSRRVAAVTGTGLALGFEPVCTETTSPRSDKIQALAPKILAGFGQLIELHAEVGDTATSSSASLTIPSKSVAASSSRRPVRQAAPGPAIGLGFLGLSNPRLDLIALFPWKRDSAPM